jgi:hypothetical protein
VVLTRRAVRETRSGRHGGHLVDCDVMVGTSPVYGTVADGDVRAQRKYVTRVVDYSNRTAAITPAVPGD